MTDDLAIPVMRCGAMLRPRDAEGRATVIRLAENAKANGVYARVDGVDGSLTVPGESVTDPVAHTLALASAAVRLGVPVWTRWRVEADQRDRTTGSSSASPVASGCGAAWR